MRGRFVESIRVVGDTWLACVIGGVLSCVGFCGVQWLHTGHYVTSNLR